MYRNSKNQGDAGVGQAIAYFTKLGYIVSIPLTDSQDYDLIVEIEDELKKVQVKTGTTFDRNVPVIYAGVSGGNKTGTSFKSIEEQKWDLLYCWHIEADKHYLIPNQFCPRRVLVDQVGCLLTVWRVRFPSRAPVL